MVFIMRTAPVLSNAVSDLYNIQSIHLLKSDGFCSANWFSVVLEKGKTKQVGVAFMFVNSNRGFKIELYYHIGRIWSRAGA